MPTKYLGKRVKDVRKKGLDSYSEFIAIANAVIKDYKAKKITKNVARGRLLLLWRLTDPQKNSKAKALTVAQRKKILDYTRKLMRTL